MSKILKKLKIFKNIGFYSIINVLNSGISFLLLPILTKHLSPQDYGIIDIFINISFIAAPIVGLSIGSSVLRFYFDENKLDFRVFIYNVLIFLSFFGLFCVFISWLAPFFLFNQLSDYNLPKNIIVLAIIYSLSSQIGEIVLSLFRAEEKPFYYGVYRVLKTLMDLGFSLFLVVILNYGWEGRVYVQILVAVLFAFISILILFKRYKIKLEKIKTPVIRKALKYSFPLVFHGLSGSIISFSDRFFILKYLDIESVGVYAVAYQIGMLMSLVNNSFNQAWTPFVFKKLKTGNYDTIIKLKKFDAMYFILMLFLAVLIFLTVPSLYKYLIDESFKVNTWVVFYVLLGYAFNGMYKLIVNYLFYYKKTKMIAFFTFCAAFVNIIFCIILIPKLGILGASISTAIAFLVLFLLVYVYYHKVIKPQIKELKNL